MPTITFTDDKERTVPIFRMLLQKSLDEIICIFTDHLLIVVILLTGAVAHAGGLVEPQHVSRFSPTVWVEGCRCSIGIDGTWSIFGKECECGGAARSTREPQNEWNFLRGGCGSCCRGC